MRSIQKSKEPTSLTEHRGKPHSNYDNYPDKDGLRAVMHKDQGGICCYCMSRIKEPTKEFMKIEHFYCQRDYPELEIKFVNLFASCRGNEGQKRDKQHCDTRKKHDSLSKELISNQYDIESLIQYSGDGTISSSDDTFDRELNEVLNLNCTSLKNARKGVLDGFKEVFKHPKFKNKPLGDPWFEKQLEKWDSLNNKELYRPYFQVVVYWLRKRLNRG